MKLTQKMQDIFKRRKVTLRPDNQVVEHATYGCKTVLTPEQFAVYEAAMKSHFVGTATNFAKQEQWSEFMGCIAHYNSMLDKNDICLPWIEDEDVTNEKINEAADDYDYCAKKLMNEEGEDYETGKVNNVYHSTLD